MMNNLKRITLAILCLLLAGNAQAYRVHFNRIICVNPLLLAKERQFNTITEVVELFQKQCNRPMEGNFLNKALTMYWDNKKTTDVPYLSETYLAGLTGTAGSIHNDKFYITYKDVPREGMVLPLHGGHKDMYANAHWRPTAAEGNPSVIGQGFIRYYLYESNLVFKDELMNYFSIDLAGMVNKGPQLVLLTSGPEKEKKKKGKEKDEIESSTQYSVYVIEYEVKP